MERDGDDLAQAMGKRDAQAMQTWLAGRRRYRILAELSGTVAARLDAGRWLADCPFCGGAEMVARSAPFFCLSCGMAGNGRRPMTILYPDDEVS